MLDLGFVRDNLELVKQKMRERGVPDLLGDFENLDRERRNYLAEAERRKARRNKMSEEIAAPYAPGAKLAVPIESSHAWRTATAP